jgi:multidrug efflux pump subunit AcrA (membrane-fusion protein)
MAQIDEAGDAMSMNSVDVGQDVRESDVAKPARVGGAARTPPLHATRLKPGDQALRSSARKKRRRKNRLLLLLFVITAATIAVGWWWFTQNRRGSGEPTTLTATVERRNFSSSVLATGAVKPQVGAEVRVGARISGKVAKLRTNIGDRVTQGQVIAELEKADLEAVVAQREAEVQLAEAKLAAVDRLLPKEIQKAELDVSRWQATCKLCEQEIERQSQLLKFDATTEQSFEEAQERLDVANIQLASAGKALELDKARYEEDLKQALPEIDRARSALSSAEIQLSYATLTAPIDGVIASVSTQEGETVAAGMQAPTFVTIIDLERLQVDAYVDEVDIGKVRPGQEALFTVDTFPDREFRGRVAAIYPKAVIQDNVVNYDVVVEILDEHRGSLRPEMTASVTILQEVKTDVLAIPAKAVKREQGKNVVYVSSDGRPKACEVTIGWKDGQWVEVLVGLEEGQTVFLESPTTSEPKS